MPVLYDDSGSRTAAFALPLNGKTPLNGKDGDSGAQGPEITGLYLRSPDLVTKSGFRKSLADPGSRSAFASRCPGFR
jgi:hypothetical protein